MMLKVFTVGIAVLAVSGAASAADKPQSVQLDPAASSVWDGVSLGVVGGWGSARAGSAFSFSGQPFGYAKNRLTGAFGGIQGGYNWSAGRWVFGAEIDLQATGLDDALRAGCPASVCGGAVSASYSQRLPWFGTARARFGYAFGDALIYATGGYAMAGLETTASAVAGPAFARASWTDVHHGWVLGGGAEVALSSNWSLRGEWLHLGFAPEKRRWAAFGASIHDQSNLRLDIIRTGLNYRF